MREEWFRASRQPPQHDRSSTLDGRCNVRTAYFPPQVPTAQHARFLRPCPVGQKRVGHDVGRPGRFSRRQLPRQAGLSTPPLLVQNNKSLIAWVSRRLTSFRHRAVETSKARLDVDQFDAEFDGHQTTGDCVLTSPTTSTAFGLVRQKHRLEAFMISAVCNGVPNRRRNRGSRRLGNAQLAEEKVAHLVVVSAGRLWTSTGRMNRITLVARHQGAIFIKFGRLPTDVDDQQQGVVLSRGGYRGNSIVPWCAEENPSEGSFFLAD